MKLNITRVYTVRLITVQGLSLLCLSALCSFFITYKCMMENEGLREEGGLSFFFASTL